MIEVFKNLWETSGIASMTWQQGVMILVSFILFYLAIKKQYEPLLLLPIAFGMLLTNLPLPPRMVQRRYQLGSIGRRIS